MVRLVKIKLENKMEKTLMLFLLVTSTVSANEAEKHINYFELIGFEQKTKSGDGFHRGDQIGYKDYIFEKKTEGVAKRVVYKKYRDKQWRPPVLNYYLYFTSSAKSVKKHSILSSVDEISKVPDFYFKEKKCLKEKIRERYIDYRTTKEHFRITVIRLKKFEVFLGTEEYMFRFNPIVFNKYKQQKKYSIQIREYREDFEPISERDYKFYKEWNSKGRRFLTDESFRYFDCRK